MSVLRQKCLNLTKGIVSKPHIWKRLCSFDPQYSHVPVMTKEVIEMLQPEKDKIYIDMTFGAGGHTEQILQSAPNITVIALDRDKEAINRAKVLAELYEPNQLVPIWGRFSELPKLLEKLKMPQVDGMLFDLGCSSMQFDDPGRGFALSKNGPLDMRMDRDVNKLTAMDVVNRLDQFQLEKIFKIYGEEKRARDIANAIVDARYLMIKLETTSQLADLVYSCVGTEKRTDKMNRASHVATKIFQAIRIFVNDELNQIEHGMRLAYQHIKPGGRLVVLTFHSLEDRLVKQSLGKLNVKDQPLHSLRPDLMNPHKLFSVEEIKSLNNNRWTLINKHVMVPMKEEMDRNPRCRSAKLRAAIRN